MKNLINRLALLTIVAMTGCSQGTPGGPGTTDVTVKKPIYGQTEDTFNLSVPLMSTTLQQGESASVEVGIERAKNFGDDVELRITDLPTGVTVSPVNLMIKHGDMDVRMTLQATDEATPGDYSIKVIGHPAKGGDAQVEFKISITAKDTFTLALPRLSTSLKQGETKTVAISISRDQKFNQDVTLKFGEMPTGVSLDPVSPVIKQGESETEITLTAASDAALGDFTINVTGHPSTGADASEEFALSVVTQ